MVKFYVLAVLVVFGLVFAPVVLLAMRERNEYEGKVVLYGSYPAKVKSIDPATCGDTISATMQANVYEPLYAYHYLKRPAELIPCLAEDMPEVSPDGLTYTIRILKDVKYARNECFGFESDGRTPRTRTVRAEDFVLTIKRAADVHIQTPMAWTFLSGRIRGLDEFRERCKQYREGDFSRYDLPVEGVTAVDEHTLRLTLVQPYPQMVHVLAMHSYSPVPRELIDYHLTSEPAGNGQRRPIPVAQRTAQITRPDQTVGTGPYILTKFDRSGEIIFERNPDYRLVTYPTEGEPSDRQKGLLEDAGKPVPFVDVLRYDFVPESLPAWLGFLSRRYDTSAIPPDVFTSVISPDRQLLDRWRRQGIELVTYEEPSVFWMAFNMEDPVLRASRSLRHAICLAYDVESYIDVLWNGRGRRPVNILPDSFPGHREAGPGPYYRYDPAAARAKLEEARRELAAAGLLDANGDIPPLSLDLGGLDEFQRRAGDFDRQQFEKIGLRVKINLMDWPTLQQKVHNKQSQLYGMGWHADYPDPENFLQLFYGPNIEMGTNNTNYRNPEFDALYEKARVMNDSPERLDLYVRMVRILNEDCPVLPTLQPELFLLKHAWVKNNKRHPFGYGNSKYIRIDADLRRRMGGR